jgi:hypothetical protein
MQKKLSDLNIFIIGASTLGCAEALPSSRASCWSKFLKNLELIRISTKTGKNLWQIMII